MLVPNIIKYVLASFGVTKDCMEWIHDASHILIKVCSSFLCYHCELAELAMQTNTSTFALSHHEH